MWLHGYWEYDWADNYVKVLSVNHASNEIIIDSKTPTLYSMLLKYIRSVMKYTVQLYCVEVTQVCPKNITQNPTSLFPS